MDNYERLLIIRDTAGMLLSGKWADEDFVRLRKVLKEMNTIQTPPKNKNDKQEWERMVDKARQYPVTDLIEFRRGVACCLWHDDKHPSMATKNNRVHCFSCGHWGDSIDVQMKLTGQTFMQAVRALQ